MPQLGEHQLRVAAVAEMICGQFDANSDSDSIVKACLLHDMGNILKFDLQKTGNILNLDTDIDYWQKVKQGYVKKYGTDEHGAHKKIAREIGASPRVIELIDCIGFATAVINAESLDFGKKICCYADSRVAPWGVVTLEERFADLRKRYYRHAQNSPERNAYEAAMKKIEQQIFAHCNIKPEDITEESITERKEKLRSFEI